MLKPALLWGRVPKLFMAIASLYGVIDRRGSPLDPVLRSLVTVRVSQLNWCRFCVDINSATLAARAGSVAKVDALDAWRDSDLFNPREKAALEYAEAMTDSNRRVSNPMVARLRDFFTDDAIVELTGLIAFQNLSSKFNSAPMRRRRASVGSRRKRALPIDDDIRREICDESLRWHSQYSDCSSSTRRIGSP